MMKLFELRADFNVCCTFRFSPSEDIHQWDEQFMGAPRPQGYTVPKGERRDEENADGPLPDYTDFALLYPAFSSRARQCLDGLLIPHGEFAAIEMGEPMRYFAFNATTIVDVLDEGRSEIARFRSGGVMAVDRHVVQEAVTRLPPIFKIPQTRRNTTYVNEEFVSEVRRCGLLGFRFDLLFER